MISLPLAKLSTARDATLNETKFNWSHETQNLTVVIDSYGQLIEIEHLINETNELIRTMQKHGVELKNEQLLISALVRCPLLAIRCQLPDKKIRRLQLKFKNSNDYDIAYSHLHQLGLRMSTSNEGHSRCLTPSSTRTLAPSPSTSSSSPDRNTQAAGPSCPPSRLTEISNRPYTAVTAPTSVESQVQEAVHARPMSAYTGHSDSTRSTATSFSGPLRPPEYFTRPDLATSTILDLSPVASAYSSYDQPFTTIENNSTDRPETALLFNRPDTAEAALPPRRELPFPRSSVPRSAGSDTARPSTSTMGPPPLPARVASLRPASSRSTNQQTELPPLPKPTVIGSAQQPPSWMQQAPRTPKEDQLIPPANNYDDQENRPLSNSSSSSSPLSYKRATTNISPYARPLSILSTSSQNRRGTEPQNSLFTPPTLIGDRQTRDSTETSRVLDATADNDLAVYAMQSEEGRRAALNEFIFKHLEDKHFLTLLEDMETCWARSGLGMK